MDKVKTLELFTYPLFLMALGFRLSPLSNYNITVTLTNLVVGIAMGIQICYCLCYKSGYKKEVKGNE